MTDLRVNFFSRLGLLDSGDRAALRREAGSLLRQAGGRAVSVFYSCLPSAVEGWQEDRWFAIACLSCLWDAEAQTGTPLEQIIANLIRNGELSDSTKHRVELLLDTAWDTDGYLLTKLARLVKMIRQKTDRAQIDFSALLDDLLYWNAENQSVQRKWAKAIFSTKQTTESEE